MPLDSTTAIQMTAGGRTFTVWDEGTREKFSIVGNEQASKAVRRLRCAWADRIALVGAILGSSNQVAGTNIYTAGQPYPDVPGWVAREMDITGDGVLSVATSGQVAYQWAVIQILYYPAIYDNNGIATQRLSTSSTTLATSRDQPTFKWGSDSKPMPATQTPTVSFTTVQITIERQLAILDLALYAGLASHRNSAPVFGLATDKVAYWGIGGSQRTITAFGATMFTVDLNFEYNPYGWNKLFRPDTGAFDTFKFADGSELYPPSDLNQLLL